MARNLNLDTTKQEFLKESYRKESTLRNKWFQGYFGSNVLPSNLAAKEPVVSPLPANHRGKPILINIKPAPPTPPKKASPTFAEPVLDGSVKVKEMRTASPDTKNMIYTGLSSEGDGRMAYLTKRKAKGPEEKFEYPLTSALEVGWNINQVVKSCTVKEVHYGKSRIVRDTFFAENGVM